MTALWFALSLSFVFGILNVVRCSWCVVHGAWCMVRNVGLQSETEPRHRCEPTQDAGRRTLDTCVSAECHDFSVCFTVVCARSFNGVQMCRCVVSYIPSLNSSAVA